MCQQQHTWYKCDRTAPPTCCMQAVQLREMPPPLDHSWTKLRGQFDPVNKFTDVYAVSAVRIGCGSLGSGGKISTWLSVSDHHRFMVAGVKRS